VVDPFEQLLGPFDPLLAESNLFHELRLPAVEGGQSVQSLEIRVVGGCVRGSAIGPGTSAGACDRFR